MQLSANTSAGTSEVTLVHDWQAFGSIRDKTTPFGAWVNRTLAMFGCPTDDEVCVPSLNPPYSPP
jgi:hypothetical protein